MRGLVAGVALTLAVSATPAAADTTPYLPAPTGHRLVGTTSLYLKDTSRADPWVPSMPYRELTVSVFYPAASANGPKAQYDPAESAAMLTGSGIEAAPDILSKTRTNSVAQARPNRIGMAGHSVGGANVTPAMVADPASKPGPTSTAPRTTSRSPLPGSPGRS
jgi:hypothetical protein